MNKEQRVRERAHNIWESEGRPEGRDFAHWQRALNEIEKEMRAAERRTDAGFNEAEAANIYVHRGGHPSSALPGFEASDGIHTPGVPAIPSGKNRD